MFSLFRRLFGRPATRPAPPTLPEVIQAVVSLVPPEPPAEAAPKTRAETPPLVAAYEQAKQNPQDWTKGVQVEGRTDRPQCVPSCGVKVAVLEPGEITGYCKANPIFDNKLDPPAHLSFAQKAAWLTALAAIPDWDRAKLYAVGGIPLLRATVDLALEKMGVVSKADA